jgi:MULE transposase domain
MQGGQVSTLLNKLAQFESQEPGWHHRFWHSDEDRLAWFFWMSPYQIAMARLYGHVLIVDVTENKNMYGMYLATYIVIDGENRSRNVAYCLSDRQDQLTFAWAMELLHTVTYALSESVSLFAVFSDRALAIVGAVAQVWPDVFHGTCLWHLHENLIKNLRGPLGKVGTRSSMNSTTYIVKARQRHSEFRISVAAPPRISPSCDTLFTAEWFTSLEGNEGDEAVKVEV